LPENGSSQGQNLALAVAFVPNSLDSGLPAGGLLEGARLDQKLLELFSNCRLKTSFTQL